MEVSTGKDRDVMTKLIEDQSELVKWVNDQDGDLDLAVAFWGHDASAFLGLGKTRRRVRIVLEISQGATNIKEVRKLLKMPQVEVKSYERLHAKAYISADEVIIGSANASAGGLGIVGFENKHWKELGIQTRSREVIQRAKSWFEELWLAAEQINSSELDRIEKLQKVRAKLTPPMDWKAKDIFDSFKHHLEEWKDHNIWITVITSELSDEQEAILEERQKLQPEVEVYAYAEWPSIPKDAMIISFTWYADEDFNVDDPLIYRTPGVPQKGMMQYVFPTNLPGFEIGEVAKWKAATQKARDADPSRWKRRNGLRMPLREFIEKYS